MFKSLFETAKKLVNKVISFVKELASGLTTHKEMTEEQVVEVVEKRKTIATRVVIVATVVIASILFPVAVCLLLSVATLLVTYAIADILNDISNTLSARSTTKAKA
jgi:hypothetical protein